MPKLLGSYEQELWPSLRHLASLPITHVINIGCAEGYYTAGLARLLPQATIHAFDCLETARESTRRMAAANSVSERVTIGGACDAVTLSRLPLQGAVVFIDCEGAEFDILDPVVAPGLAGSWLLVELHDFVDPRITPELRRRFGKTHQIEIIDAAPRHPRDFPSLSAFPPAQQRLALDENRNCHGIATHQQWAFMRPRRILPENAE